MRYVSECASAFYFAMLFVIHVSPSHTYTHVSLTYKPYGFHEFVNWTPTGMCAILLMHDARMREKYTNTHIPTRTSFTWKLVTQKPQLNDSTPKNLG